MKKVASNGAKWRSIISWLLLLMAANAAVLWSGVELLQLVGGLVLFCLLPGWALVAWLLPGESLLERLLLALGSSYVLANLTMLALHAVPGPLNVLTLCLALDALTVLLTGGALLRRGGGALCPRRREERERGAAIAVAFVALVVLAAFFRFATLGYAEFQGDEVGVVSAAVEAILGHDDVLFLQRKGPLETLMTTAFVLFIQGFDEFALRLPFALASFLGVMTTCLIGRQMFGSGVGFIAGLLFAIEGITLAFSRMVQYQGVAVFMLALCVYCFYRLHRAIDSELAYRYQFLGAAFFAFGLLTHYDVGPVALLVAFIYLSKYGPRFRRGDVLALLGSLVIAAAILLVFYLPFILHPHFRETGLYVAQNRLGVGQGPYNNLGTFVSYSIFYNSTYYVALMMVLLVAGVTGTLVKGWSHRPPAYLLSASFAVALFLSALFPSIVSVNQASYAFVLFLPAVIGLVLSRQLEAGERIVLLWFFIYFVVYCFMVREPGLHFYTLSAAWAVLGGVVLDKSYRYLRSCSGIVIRRGVGLACLLFYALLACYTYVFFIQTDPEYAMTFPENKVALYWTPQVAVPGSGRFGIPRRSGWKAISYLYRMGALRGGYTTNARKSKTLEWYTRTLLAGFEMPRYFFFSEDAAPARRDGAGISKESVEDYYDLVGRVMVKGRPKVLIYEDKRFARGGPPIDYRSEEYESWYDNFVSLAGYRLWEKYGGDDRDFQAVGRFLEASAHPNGGLILSAPQVDVLSYYYRGDLPYYPLPRGQPLDESETATELEAILAEHDLVYGLFWTAEEEESDPYGFTEGWLEQHGRKVTERWFGNVRLALYTSAHKETGEGTHYLQELMLGEGIELLAYEVDSLLVEPGHAVDLTLYWAARLEIGEDYTVFTHLIDAEDRLWTQQDNQPREGERPTSGWREGEVVVDRYHLLLPSDIPAGQYRLEVGMYQWQTGERLSVFQGGQEAGNRVLLAEITVE